MKLNYSPFLSVDTEPHHLNMVGPVKKITFKKKPLEVTYFSSSELVDKDLERIFETVTASYKGDRYLCGNRSVLLPSDTKMLYDGIKVKGAGFRGDLVRFDQLYNLKYDIPRYDFNGNYTLDQAKGFAHSPLGGMTYQQAANEFKVIRYLQKRNYPTLPALGHGVIQCHDQTNWFCVLNAPYRESFEWQEDLKCERSALEIAYFFGSSQRELKTHGVYLVLAGRLMVNDALLRKDFHTAHIANENDSFMSLLCYYLFDINFMLYHFQQHYFIPGQVDYRDSARVHYIKGLTGREFNIAEITAFKQLLLKFKYGDSLRIEHRVSLLKQDPIGRHLLNEFLPANMSESSYWESI